MFKRRGLLFAVLLLVVGIAAVAGAADPKYLRIGTASLGGNYFPMGAAIGVLIEEKIPGIKATPQATGGSSFNLVAMEEGEQELALCQGPAVAEAVKSGESTRARTVANYNSTPQHILVRKASNIKSIADFKGKSIEVIAAGDGIETTTRLFMDILGIGWDNIEPVYSGNRVQASSDFKTGAVDGIIDATGVGAAWIGDILGDGSDFELISLSDEDIEKISSVRKEFSVATIPANSYRGQPEEVKTVGNWVVVVAREDLSDDLVYNITKEIVENRDFLKERHNYFKDVAAENIVGAVIAPLHPGAEKYYKEAGVLK
ncbi:MAG: TAXI family TRAP transporter solute-binding subunit [Synergistaceae bacterium]|nr:TAXI family TRAP transporter solute-binding subunit [Synergistaceae bacterium]